MCLFFTCCALALALFCQLTYTSCGVAVLPDQCAAMWAFVTMTSLIFSWILSPEALELMLEVPPVPSPSAGLCVPVSQCLHVARLVCRHLLNDCSS